MSLELLAPFCTRRFHLLSHLCDATRVATRAVAKKCNLRVNLNFSRKETMYGGETCLQQPSKILDGVEQWQMGISFKHSLLGFAARKMWLASCCNAQAPRRKGHHTCPPCHHACYSKTTTYYTTCMAHRNLRFFTRPKVSPETSRAPKEKTRLQRKAVLDATERKFWWRHTYAFFQSTPLSVVCCAALHT